jgi:hypothetical protein
MARAQRRQRPPASAGRRNRAVPRGGRFRLGTARNGSFLGYLHKIRKPEIARALDRNRSRPSRTPGQADSTHRRAPFAGPLAEGQPARTPIGPRTDDERQLAKLIGEGDELSYLELVRHTLEIVADSGFIRIHRLASELVAQPPHELTGEQLADIREATVERIQVATFECGGLPAYALTASRASDCCAN